MGGLVVIGWIWLPQRPPASSGGGPVGPPASKPEPPPTPPLLAPPEPPGSGGANVWLSSALEQARSPNATSTQGIARAYIDRSVSPSQRGGAPSRGMARGARGGQIVQLSARRWGK